jgi:hypothetical protein
MAFALPGGYVVAGFELERRERLVLDLRLLQTTMSGW